MSRCRYRRDMDEVVTNVPDLSGIELAEALKPGAIAPPEAVRQLLERVEQPGRSISGYNPQRLN